MPASPSSCVGAVLLILSGLLQSAFALEIQPEDAPSSGPPAGDQALVPPADRLSELARAAKADFIARSQADVDRTRKSLDRALRRLDGYLTPGGGNGLAWKRFLLWDSMQAGLNEAAEGDLPILEAVYKRYRADQVGLELIVFADVARALENYLDTLEQVRNPDPRPEFDEHLDLLATSLEAYRRDGSEAELGKIGQAVGWLQRRGQAPQLVAAVRRHYSQPNLFVQVSAEVIAAGIARPVDDVAPVRDMILGTRISGTGRTVGRVEVELVPEPDRAVIETVLVGTNFARTVGRNGPARIHSTGQTELVGRKRLVIDAEGLRALPAASAGRTKTRIRGVSSTARGCVDRLVRRVAWKRIPRQKSASERVASRHAEQKLNGRLDEEAGGFVARANREFLEKFRNPLVRRGEFPRGLRFSTTADVLGIVALHDGVTRLAAPTAPPEVLGRPGVSVRLHESLVNNLAAGMLAGETLDQDEFEQLAIRVLGALPEELEDDDKGPWSMTFAEPEPITLRIAEGSLVLTIRGQRYTSAGRRFDAMNVTVRYRLERAGAGLQAVRQGELEVFPPGFVPGSGRTIPLRHTVLRNLLLRRFGTIFQEEIVSEGLKLPGQWSKMGTLEVAELEADRGWLVLSWEKNAARTVRK